MKEFIGHDLPPFADKLSKAVSDAWMCEMSGIGCKFVEEDNQFEVIFYPALREIIGGPQDGERYSNGFDFNIGKFTKVFDRPGAKIHLDCINKNLIDHLFFDGKIDGYKVHVAILVSAPDGESPLERVYVSGPKAGTVESVDANPES